jgi:lysophospholipase L1-like esterase
MNFAKMTCDRFFIKLGKATIFLLITILIIFLFELVSWNILIILKERYLQDENRLELLYDKKNVDNYKNMLLEVWGRKPTFKRKSFVEFIEKEYQGKYVKISPYGFRYVKNQVLSFLDKNKINIFVFGGSTTFGYGVSNDETIPSYIQELLNKNYNNIVAIYNFGCGYHYSSQERIWFEQFIVNGVIPDIVIFIDGLNDFYFSKMKGGSYFSDQIAFISVSNIGFIIKTLINESATLNLCKAIVNEINWRSGQANANLASDNEILRAADRLSTNREMIRAVSKKFKITPIFVQQPVPMYNYDNSKRVFPADLKRLNKHINSKRGYEIMVEQRKSGKITNKDILWCQNLKIDEVQYIDTVHYSPQYSMRIAEAIVDYIDTNNIIRNNKKYENILRLGGKSPVGSRNHSLHESGNSR